MTVETVEKKPVRGRPFSAKNQPDRSAVRRDPPAETDFGTFARSILTDKKAQRAIMRRARAGTLPAHIISQLVENASPPPAQEEREPATSKELAAWMAESTPAWYQLALYQWEKGQRGDDGKPTDPTSGLWTPVVVQVVEPEREREEPALSKVNPLGEAAKRLREAEKAVKRVAQSEPARLTQLQQEDAERELAARAVPRTALPGDQPEHDWADVKHRAGCRECRKRWRENNA